MALMTGCLHEALHFHPCSTVYQHFIPFTKMTFYHKDMSHFVYPFSLMDCFHLSAVMNDAAVNMRV